jgi:hypothetical protein
MEQVAAPDVAGGAQAPAGPVAAPALGATRTSLAASLQRVRRRHRVQFTATVQDAAEMGTPTGTVDFLVGDRITAQVPLDGGGEARWTGRFATRGRVTIQAVFSGDGHFAGSSQSLSVRVV